MDQLSARVRRLRYVVDGMQPQVDAAIARAIGPRFFLRRLTAERLSDWRSRAQTLAAVEAGFAFAAYGQLKFSGIVENIVARLIRLGGFDMRGGGETVRREIWETILAQKISDVGQVTRRGGGHSPFVGFLRAFDLEYRIRRLRFLLRRINSLAADLPDHDEDSRDAIEHIKSAIYRLMSPYLHRRDDHFYSALVRASAAASPLEPAVAMDALRHAMGLTELDTRTDEQLVTLFDLISARPLRQAMLRAYLGFSFYDIVVLPLLQGDGIDEFDEIMVDRISPADSTVLTMGEGAAKFGQGQSVLKGTQLNSFGAFFSRAYRENDYLWGRLHGVDRLIDIIASTLTESSVLSPERILYYKIKAFSKVLDSERGVLTHVPELIAALDAQIAELKI
jgi:patatin-related protein